MRVTLYFSFSREKVEIEVETAYHWPKR
ncbi:MAG: hypothetical protein ACI8TS_001414, partial [Flavobacteriales bacterium]